MELPLSSLNANEISLSLVNHYQNTWPLAISLISSGRVDVGGIQTHSFALSQTAEALVVGCTDPESLKAVIYPQRG